MSSSPPSADTPSDETARGISLSGLNPVQVATFQEGTTPRAVVVLVGDIGQTEENLDTVAGAYQARRCATIGVSRTIFANTNGAIDEYAEQVVEQSYKLLSKYEEEALPLIVHVFGNGGGYVLKRVEELMKTANEDSSSRRALTEPLLLPQGQEQIQLLAQRLKKGAILYDSAPAYPHILGRLQELRAAIPHPVIFAVVCVGMTLYYLLVDLLILGSSKKYWKYMEQHRMTLREAYVYSIGDPVTDYQELDRLIESRKKANPEMSITTRKFHFSNHCQHMHLHKKAYCLLMDDILKSIAQDGAAK